ncbi:MAG: M12 family metallopeptidase, partial [Rudanella sp.]|nr:M12 family metallopeptidase [Rudanella sp.]
MKSKIYRLSAVAVLSYVVSCTPPDQTNSLTPQLRESVHTEQAYPGQTGPWLKGYWLNSEVQYQSLNGEAIMDGDMVFHPHDLSGELLPQPQTTGRARASAKWPNRTVIYQIDPSVPYPDLVTQAISHWEATTPIRFVQRTFERAFVRFRGGRGCSSNVGRIGVEQYITLSSACTLGNI